jgi:hypothetical protein
MISQSGGPVGTEAREVVDGAHRGPFIDCLVKLRGVWYVADRFRPMDCGPPIQTMHSSCIIPSAEG